MKKILILNEDEASNRRRDLEYGYKSEMHKEIVSADLVFIQFIKNARRKLCRFSIEMNPSN